LIQINDTPDCKFREYNVPKNQWWCHEDGLRLFGTGCPPLWKKYNWVLCTIRLMPQEIHGYDESRFCYVKRKGYIVRGSGTGFNSGNTVNASFSGVPNNGVSRHNHNKFHLIGNPTLQLLIQRYYR
jgi:hypothetical protein